MTNHEIYDVDSRTFQQWHDVRVQSKWHWATALRWGIAMQHKVLVIGYGNSIRGDDAFGPVVADRLEESSQLPCVSILSRHLLTPELAENIRDARLVIFVDASADGAVGQVLCRRIYPDPGASMSMAHHLEPGGLLLWTQEAYQRSPEAYMVSTRGAAFEFADAELSPAVAAAVPVAVQQIRELILGSLIPGSLIPGLLIPGS